LCDLRLDSVGDLALTVFPRPFSVAKHSKLAILACYEEDVTVAGFDADSVDDVLCRHVLVDKLDELPLAEIDDFLRLVILRVLHNDLIDSRLLIPVGKYGVVISH